MYIYISTEKLIAMCITVDIKIAMMTTYILAFV